MNKEYLERIIKTFIQGVLSALIVQLASGVDVTDKEAVKALVIGVIAAGFSAVMNINKAKKEAETVFEEVAEDDIITEDEK